MKEIVFLRHAKSSWEYLADHDDLYGLKGLRR